MQSLDYYARQALQTAHKALDSSYRLYRGNVAQTATLLQHSDGTQADIEPISVDAAIRLGIAPDDAETAQEIWIARLRQADFAESDLPINATYWIDDGSTRRAFKARKRTESKVQGLEFELLLVRG